MDSKRFTRCAKNNQSLFTKAVSLGLQKLSILTVHVIGEQLQEGEAASQGSQSKDILRDVSPLP